MVSIFTDVIYRNIAALLENICFMHFLYSHSHPPDFTTTRFGELGGVESGMGQFDNSPMGSYLLPLDA